MADDPSDRTSAEGRSRSERPERSDRSTDDARSPSASVGDPRDGDSDPPSGDGFDDPGASDDFDGPSSLAAALGVRPNAELGIVVATVLVAVAYTPQALRFVVGDGELGAAIRFLLLAFVLWFSVAFTITVALTARAGLRPVLDHEAWLRRGGIVAAAGGIDWLCLPALVWLGSVEQTVPSPFVAAWQTWVIVSTLFVAVGAVTLHAAVKTASGRLEIGGYVLALVGLVLAAANATGSAAPVQSVDGAVVPTPFLLGVLLALCGTVALAAGADLTDRLPSRPLQFLLATALIGVLAAVPLLAFGWVETPSNPGTRAFVVAAVVSPVGIGWVAVGRALWRNAGPIVADAPTDAPSRVGDVRATDDGSN